MSAFNRERVGRLPPRPWPWERRVTICIAAACRAGAQNRDYAVVLCADWQTSNDLGSMNSFLKLRILPHGFLALTSGSTDEILATLPIIKARFQAETEINETNVIRVVEKALTDRKNNKIESIISGEIGLGYEEFKQIGRNNLPDDVFRDLWLKIRLTRMEAHFIIVGFQIGMFPMMVATTDEYTAAIKDDFTAVGSGDYLAKSALMQRGQNDTWKVERTLYNVFEAKRLSENVTTVGKTTMLQVLHQNGKRETVTKEGLAYLNKKFIEYGPQAVLDVAFEEGFFETSQHPLVPRQEESG